MNYRRRRIALVGASAALAVAAASNTPSSLAFQFQTHDAADLTPHKVRAAFDLGLVCVSVLYTWSERVTR